MSPKRAGSASRASEEHARQAVYYNARRREHSYKVGDLVWKINRVLSSAAQEVSAKPAPTFAGPYRVMAKTGSNTLKVADMNGAGEETLHVSHLKPYLPEQG